MEFGLFCVRQIDVNRPGRGEEQCRISLFQQTMTGTVRQTAVFLPIVGNSLWLLDRKSQRGRGSVKVLWKRDMDDQPAIRRRDDCRGLGRIGTG